MTWWLPKRAPAPEMIQLPSPHSRTREQAVSTLVVHAMGEWIVDDEGRFRHATDWLDHLRLSVHAFILPSGRIIQTLDPKHFVAFHVRGVNNISAGCEFLIAGPQSYHDLLEKMRDTTHPPYTEAQYRSGGFLYGRWARTLGLPWAAVQGHEAIDPARKYDPGPAFSWDRLEYWFDRAA